MTKENHIPDDYTSITPYFTVSDADAFIEFLSNAFDARIIKQDRGQNNRIQHALQSGAQSIMPPNDRPHGDRMAGITDPSGNTWWIATHRS